MRIAFDASATVKRERTGVGRYAASLLDALIEGHPELEITLGFRLSRWKRAKHRYRSSARNVKPRWFVDPFAPELLGACDVFHGLDAKLPSRFAGPMIATLHDVGAVERAEIASAGFRDKKTAAYADLAQRATRIVCVSQSARDAFRNLHAVALDRFAVIHHGVGGSFVPQPAAVIATVRERYRLPIRFLLFVGLISARKNLTRLIRAFDAMAHTDPDLALVLAGGSGHGGEEVDAEIARSQARARILRLGFVPDADLPALYAAADGFVFPGLVEGFGMPMIEAMACGTPVLAADRPVTHEVAGDAALIVDGEDEGALAAGLRRLIEDTSLRRDLMVRGELRAQGFTWRAAAERTVAVYREAARVR